jgi:predicted RNA-binding protein YlxR (DUF448 family)
MQGRPHHEALDSGPRQTPPGSERFCAATGAVRPVNEMIRFVVAPDGTVVPDLKRRLPGRGLWITATAPALRNALTRKAFAKGFKREVRLAADFVEATERLLERAALDALAIAHKAGKTAIGFGQVEAALTRDRVVAVIHAADAAADGVRKLNAALRQRPDAGNIDIIGTFASAQLNLALGRSNVIHAALLAGPESETVLARAARLGRFRTGATDTPENPGTRERNG